jgi:hypothetical protein
LPRCPFLPDCNSGCRHRALPDRHGRLCRWSDLDPVRTSRLDIETVHTSRLDTAAILARPLVVLRRWPVLGMVGLLRRVRVGLRLRLCTGATIAPRYPSADHHHRVQAPHVASATLRRAMVPVVTLRRQRSTCSTAEPRMVFALPFSEFGWRAFSKNRVKPLLLLDTGQQCAFSQNSRTQVAN